MLNCPQAKTQFDKMQDSWTHFLWLYITELSDDTDQSSAAACFRG